MDWDEAECLTLPSWLVVGFVLWIVWYCVWRQLQFQLLKPRDQVDKPFSNPFSVSKRMEHEHKVLWSVSDPFESTIFWWFFEHKSRSFHTLLQGGWKRLADSTGEWFVPHGRRCWGAWPQDDCKKHRKTSKNYDSWPWVISSTQGDSTCFLVTDTHTSTWSSDVLKRMSRSTYEVNPGGLFQVAPVQCDDSGAAVDAAQLVCSCTGWWLAMFTVLN